MDPVSPQLRVSLGREAVIAKEQPPYLSLVAHLYSDTVGGSPAVTRWRFTWRERLLILLGRDLYHQVLTFGQSYPPMKMSLDPDTVRYLTEEEHAREIGVA